MGCSVSQSAARGAFPPAAGDPRTAYLTPHEHEYTQEGMVSYCPECLRQFRRRVEMLARSGYSAGVIAAFASVDGQWVRWRQFDPAPWRIGKVLDWEYPNCCLLIQDVEWYGTDGRERWLRFGWCGMLDETASVQLISAEARKRLQIE